MIFKIFKLFFSIIICFNSFSQNVSKQIKKAENSSQNYSYASAIEAYEDILKNTKNLNLTEQLKVKLNLAEAYFFVKDYKNAEKYYREVLLNNPVLTGEQLISFQRYAQVLSSLGKHSESAVNWKKYTELQQQDKRGVQFAELYKNLEPLTRNSNSYKLEYIGINTSSPDFSPTFFKDGLVFVSSRNKNSGIKRVFKWDNSSFLDLYYLEDLKVLEKKQNTAALGSGGSNYTENKPVIKPDKLGADYYTPPTANDANTIFHQGSEYITGSKDYEEYSGLEVKNFSKNINTKYHEGPSTFFHDGSKIIFTRNTIAVGGSIFGNKKEGITRLNLYIANQKNGDWGNITELPFNSNDYSCGHPSISFDDKILYFVSDMPGGYGGTDLYMSKYENGNWSKPTNLGGTVNTIGNEMFPFIDEVGGLYFSSNGHPGLGDLDIFYCNTDNITKLPIGKIRNLGAPLNSNNDDFGIITNADRTVGYFSSNRKRGGADDDIWKFSRLGSKYGCLDLIVTLFDEETKEPLNTFRFDYKKKEPNSIAENATTNSTGNIKLCLEADKEFIFDFSKEGYYPISKDFSNKNSSDFEPSLMKVYIKKIPPVIPNKVIEEKIPQKDKVLVQRRSDENKTSNIFKGKILAGESNEPISAVKVKFINKCTGEIQEVYTKKDGSYEFRRDLECDYELVSTKDNFGTSSEIIAKAIKRNIFGIKKKVAVSLNLFDTKLYKVGDLVKLENIYYDSDSYIFRDYAKKELDNLVNTLKRYPNMIIEISSHTDSRGNSLNNLRLSQLRANEVSEYITSKGINKARVKATGKGETEPINNCGDGVQCTEAEYQRNRRTEFKILTIEKY